MELGLNDFMLFSDWRKHIQASVGVEDWIVAYQYLREGGSFSYAIFGGLVPTRDVGDSMETNDWDLAYGDGMPGYTQSFTREQGETTTYHGLGNYEGVLPLVLVRDFHKVRPDHLEILEEYRLYHNLYEDRATQRFLKFSRTGEAEEVIRMSANKVEFRLKEIRQFAATKGTHYGYFFDLKRFTEKDLSSIARTDHHEAVHDMSKLLRYEFILGDKHMGDGESFARVHGKKLIAPYPIERCGIWPFIDRRDPEIEFIVGTDEFGEAIMHSSAEGKLSHPDGTNKGAPDYLHPIFFRKEVLTKYFANPDLYTVEDGRLCCAGLWGVAIDNDHAEYVSVFLGDLGRDLPFEERQYWRSFNIVPGGRKMSATNFKRSILAQFTDAAEPDHRFQYAYSELETRGTESDWPVLLPLREGDLHLLKTLRTPVTGGQSEFDQQVLSLTKILVDSLNEAALAAVPGAPTDKRGIGLLESICASATLPDFGIHIQFLRDLQDLRSTGAGHRKGKKYEKAAKKFGIPDTPLPAAFRGILERAILCMDWMRLTFLPTIQS